MSLCIVCFCLYCRHLSFFYFLHNRTWDDVVIPEGSVHLYNKARTKDKDVIIYDELMHDLHNESGSKAEVYTVFFTMTLPLSHFNVF